MYYAIEIDHSLLLLESFENLSGMSQGFFEVVLVILRGCLGDVFDVDLSSLFIVGESSHRV
jgi:hypothetical protein